MNSSSSNMEVVVNNLTELVSFNTGSVHELMSLSNNDHHQGFSSSVDLDHDHDHDHTHLHHHHQRSQLPFSLINNDIQTTPAHHHGHHHHHNHNVPVTYDSVAHFFPVGGGGPISNGTASCSNNNNALSESDNCLVNSSPQGSGTGLLGNNKTSGNYNHGTKKRKRNGEREAEKPREVVHVRAKRGQATDSHSLAERLRREKINEKLRCLQDLVPGCYKTMGMAVMLDVIINYVRSLQNQIDFLSMKLSAASLFYDFNSSDMDAMGTIHGMNGFEAQGVEKMMGEGYGVLPPFHPSWPL